MRKLHPVSYTPLKTSSYKTSYNFFNKNDNNLLNNSVTNTQINTSCNQTNKNFFPLIKSPNKRQINQEKKEGGEDSNKLLILSCKKEPVKSCKRKSIKLANTLMLNLMEIKNKSQSMEQEMYKSMKTAYNDTSIKKFNTLDNLDEMNVKKLGLWESENLEFKKEKCDNLFIYLSNVYNCEGNKQKLSDLQKLQRILESAEGINNKLDKLSSQGKNKAIDSLIEDRKKEENALILNTISKTASRYGNNSSILTRENNLGIKLEDIPEEKEGENNKIISNTKLGNDGLLYRKVINDKNRQEGNMRKDIMDIGYKIVLKKEEKEELINQVNAMCVEMREYEEWYSSQLKKLTIIKEDLEEEYDIKRRNLELNNASKEAIFTNFVTQKKLINDVVSQIDKLKNQRIKKIKETKERRNTLNKQLEINSCESEYLRYIYHLLLRETREYYYQILKNGYDVRYDGLCWVVKHLLEVNTVLEYHHFPKYLSHEQINYLIFYSKLSLEENLLNLTLRCLKNKRKKKRFEENNEKIIQANINIQNEEIQNIEKRRASVMSNMGPGYGENIKSNNNNRNHLKRNSLSINKCHKMSKFYITNKDQQYEDVQSRLLAMFNNIRDEYKDAFKFYDDQKTDDENLNRIIKQMHDELIKNNSYFGADNSNIISKFFEDNAENKDDLEMILLLREKIKQLKSFKETIKKDMIEKIKKEGEILKRNPNPQMSLKYELMCSALFGSSLAF